MAKSATALSGSATARTSPSERSTAIGIALDGHQRHFAVVVDLREARQLRARQLAHGAEEAHARILGSERVEQFGQRGLVLGPDRPDQQLAAAQSICCSSSFG